MIINVSKQLKKSYVWDPDKKIMDQPHLWYQLIDWLLYGTSAQKGYKCQEKLLNKIDQN